VRANSVETKNMQNPSASGRPGFADFRLEPSLERGVAAAGFEHPRPIQIETIPEALTGRDILGLAQTGTGKTAAFALPLLDRIVARKRRGPLALVVAPTRELATQIDAEIQTLARDTKVRTLTIYGGVSLNGQIRGLRRNPDILVACPGRLLDLHQQGHVDLSRVEALVLDEADHMFDMGFLPDLRRILALLPTERQNLLFSATMPREIQRLAHQILQDPHVVELETLAPAETIDHALIPFGSGNKRALLEQLLADEACHTAIVFTRTKHRARSLAKHLEKVGHEAVALQGNMSQSQRDRAMRGFRDGRFKVLVATDIVARGIDVAGVPHVINFDPPNTPEAYTHRIGRTGRSERTGQACTLVGPEDREWIQATERHLGEPIARRSIRGFDTTPARGQRPPRPAPENRRRGRGNRRRRSSRRATG